MQKDNEINKTIYLDFASSTPTDERVLEAMEPYWRREFGNALSNHLYGLSAERAVEDALGMVALSIGANAKEIHWTSGGTESNAWALKGVVESSERYSGSVKGLHAIICVIEHSSIAGFPEYAEVKGMNVTVVGVSEDGILDIREFEKALCPETILVSIVFANNEIGVIQPIREIGKMIAKHKKKENNFSLPNMDFRFPAFHSDASQAFMYKDINVDDLGLDMLSLDGHKMYGPKGIGALYIRSGLLLQPMFFSVNSRENKRYGTPPTPLIVGMGKAVEIAGKERSENTKRVIALRDYTIDKLVSMFPEVRINGSRTARLANNISISFPGQSHEYLSVLLGERGIYVSTKSACRSMKDVSYVLKAIKSKEGGAIRVTLGKDTTKLETDYFLETLREILKKS